MQNSLISDTAIQGADDKESCSGVMPAHIQEEDRWVGHQLRCNGHLLPRGSQQLARAAANERTPAAGKLHEPHSLPANRTDEKKKLTTSLPLN